MYYKAEKPLCNVALVVVKPFQTSEVSTFNEYDMMTDDDVVLGSAGLADNGVVAADQLGLHISCKQLFNSEDDRDSAISGRSDHRSVQISFDYTAKNFPH